jgi:hypothetical protein
VNNFPKKRKYKNKKIMCDGHKFDSIKEKNWYLKYKHMVELGIIKDLELQPKFILQETFKYEGKINRMITYSADFRFYDIATKRIIVVDVKGFKTEVYKIKRKLFLFKFPDINFIEV